jgi:hypothetical protein
MAIEQGSGPGSAGIISPAHCAARPTTYCRSLTGHDAPVSAAPHARPVLRLGLLLVRRLPPARRRAGRASARKCQRSRPARRRLPVPARSGLPLRGQVSPFRVFMSDRSDSSDSRLNLDGRLLTGRLPPHPSGLLFAHPAGSARCPAQAIGAVPRRGNAVLGTFRRALRRRCAARTDRVVMARRQCGRCGLGAAVSATAAVQLCEHGVHTHPLRHWARPVTRPTATWP